jgi:acetoacetyl-CoA synthetase
VTPLWNPSPRRAAEANMTRFMAGFRDYNELWRWSVAERDEFWASVWRFCGVKASRNWDSVTAPAAAPRLVEWFPGARLNYAANLLKHADHAPAIIATSESGARRELTHRELAEQVSRAAQALRGAGVLPGDRVAAFMPNIPETVIAFLATASIGAIWSSCSPDFGVGGVLDRFAQIEPKVFITADGVRYGGKPVETLARAGEIVSRLPSVRQVLVVTLGDPRPDLKGFARALRWQDAVALFPPREIEFAELPFEHPLAILYSSGTTGLPKCIVHGAGGTLLQHLKEQVLHTDLKPDDRIFYHTTCGWMMWNWLVSALAVGSSIVLYDGSPVHPDPGALWRLAELERVNIFGTSARYLAMIEKAGVKPREEYGLAALKTVLSTGSPLAPESYEYVYRDIKRNVHLASISGGTDIVSCFALGCPTLPVYSGQLQVRGLGMAVDVFDEEGRPATGSRGELVCHPPFPSMPLRFWNDPDGSRYRAAYFERFPGVWRHGDWAELTPQGGLIISGRSDTTLNPGGVRIGTAEIYRQVERVPEVLESLAIGRETAGDVEIVLFVRLRDGAELTEALAASIRREIREGASPHHVPRRIFAVADLPRTFSGKLSEVAVREAIHGRAPKNANALANPESLNGFVSLDWS